jgi:hypothetical protein
VATPHGYPELVLTNQPGASKVSARRAVVRASGSAPIYHVCKNFSLGFGGTRARRGHHGKGRARACLNNDFVFTNDDVIDEILQVDAGRGPVAPKERFA